MARWSPAPSCSSMCGATATKVSSTASSRPLTSCAERSRNQVGSRPSVASGIGSSPKPELAAALHRLRSTLARLKAELELAMVDGAAPPLERLVEDVREALTHLTAADDASHLRGSGPVVDGGGRPADVQARVL